MQNKTVQDLRMLARGMGITGYSRMRKNELIKAINKVRARKKAKATKKTTKSSPAVSRKKSVSNKPVSRKPVAKTPTEAPIHTSVRATIPADGELRVEDAKYVTTPPGAPMPSSEFSTELNEDIDSLRAVSSPQLSLLPQKPGLFQAYWSLEPGHLQQQPGLCLRLIALGRDSAELLEETLLSADQGHWYFHTDPALATNEIYLQLGYYRGEDDFVTAIRHGTVRIPRLTASNRTDRNWWISDEEFRHLYLLAGGRLRRGRLMWPGDSTSSR